MMKWILLIGMTILAGCAPKVLATSATGITVSSDGSTFQKADDIATAHCAPLAARQVSALPLGYGVVALRYECGAR